MKHTILKVFVWPLVLIPTVHTFAQQSGFVTGAHGIAWGGSCEPGYMKLVAGSSYLLYIINRDDEPAAPYVPGWPKGYTLDAALDLPAGQPFVTTPGLIGRLQPIRYKSMLNLAGEASLNQDPANLDLGDLNMKEFVLTFPSDLAGHTVTFRARYSHAGKTMETEPDGPIKLIAPCDRADSARIIATQVYAARSTLNYSQAVDLADSMLAEGLSDAAGWNAAMYAANAIHRYDKAIEYFDRLYNDFGVTNTVGLSRMPKFNPGGSRNPDEQRAYEIGRNDLLQLKAEQEQQQHH